MKTPASAAVCRVAGQASAHTLTRSATSARDLASGHLDNGVEDPRDVRGGRRLSDQVNAADVLTGPTSPEPSEGNTDRHLRLLATSSVSVVSYGELRELVKSQIRRECRRWDFDWEAYVADGSEWGIVEVVHRRAVQQGRERGLDLQPTDIPTDTVLMAVRDVTAEWTGEPELRPTYEDFCQEQARRGEKGRETQQALAIQRETQVLTLVDSGISNNAEIGRQLGIDRSTVGRIRRKADVAPQKVLQVPTVPSPFPAPEIPRWERWPAVQFMKQTGMVLDADQARWLADMGRCYEGEGREDDLMEAIRSSAGEGVRDPRAYLQRCVANRGDAWTVSPQLLADVLSWAGQKSLEYSLVAIGGGYVRRPLPYLREVLADAVASGRRPDGWPERPVAMAVGMARQWVPELVVVDADDAVATEDVDRRTGHLEYLRRRFGRLPWELDPDGDEASDCCIGLKGVVNGELSYSDLTIQELESSPGISKANATPSADSGSGLGIGSGSAPGPSEGRVPSRPRSMTEKLEQGLKTADSGGSDGIRRPQSHGEALKQGETTCGGPLPRKNRPGALERGLCRHPLTALLATAMDLEAVVQVDCAAGCGHRVYSDRGSLDCPCHWPPEKAAQVARIISADRC